jgi:hypothetical protein
MTHPDEEKFQQLWRDAGDALEALRPEKDAREARIELWKRQEFHNWLRWRICRAGTDWSKPGVILLLALGFAGLVFYGTNSGSWYVTAGGIVMWFTLVNLAFFTYFGLTLPGPPLALPQPAKPWQAYRAEMGLYPPGYERRKLARIWIRVQATEGAAHRFELAMEKGQMPDDLAKLLEAQRTWRMQRGDAPLTQAIVETQSATRKEINAGKNQLKIVAWKWVEEGLKGFGRERV